MIMEIGDDKSYVFNIKLAKFLCLYQMMDPKSIKYRGKNVYHIIVMSLAVSFCIVSALLIVGGIYYWEDNFPISLDYLWKVEIYLFTSYKMGVVIKHSDDLWDYLSITRYSFTSFISQNSVVQDRWRKRSVKFTNIFTMTYLMALSSFVSSSMVFRNDIIPIKYQDGSVGHYRQNVMNFYLLVSDQTYNAHYYLFYIVEAFFTITVTLLFIVFDVLLVTLCLALCFQMKMICIAFKSLGHKSFHDTNSLMDNTDEKKNISYKNDLIYDELKTIIVDHQAVMKKYEAFLNLFGQIMLVQIIISSVSLIVLWFIFIMSFSDVDRFVDSEIVIKKLAVLIPTFTFQILMLCYLFDNLHSQKDSIVFALYSSNWTEMNMKCKKLILLAMQMNNANHKRLKFTRTKIVNLEMFFKTMGDCYTVISVLINHIKSKNK